MYQEGSPFVLFRNDFLETEMIFQNPYQIIRADSPEDFFPALEEAEKKRKEGKWLAGYISYEAGYLLDYKLVPFLPEKRRIPLLHLGVFDTPDQHPVFPNSKISTEKFHLFQALLHWNETEYEKHFNALHKHLQNGNCYQICLTFPIFSRWQGSTISFFNNLCLHQPVKYGAMVNLGGPVILSRSPELFFETNTEGWIRACPMKGTAQRGKSYTEDKEIKKGLANDPKNQAENRMIIDLTRNDISRISTPGTLNVSNPFTVETYRTVHQMISTINARLLPERSLRSIFSALFPSGSVTGAPKIRAMQILRETEDFPRDIYCGTIGWVAPNGRMRFNVAIRTITLFENGEAVHNVGSGIIFDSTAETEYSECLLKIKFANMETMT